MGPRASCGLGVYCRAACKLEVCSWRLCKGKKSLCFATRGLPCGRLDGDVRTGRRCLRGTFLTWAWTTTIAMSMQTQFYSFFIFIFTFYSYLLTPKTWKIYCSIKSRWNGKNPDPQNPKHCDTSWQWGQRRGQRCAVWEVMWGPAASAC